jgi:hypothetical protein
LYFANPWGLLALLAVPAIVAIHLYHRRFPRLDVAGLHLWGMETETRSPGRRRERLPITSSLLLELLAAILLALVLSQPRFGEFAAATHLVVVLDNSASMGAKPPDEPSFRDQVIQALEERAAQLERGSVVTLILTGRRPVMLAGPAVGWSDARSKLEAWHPRAPTHEFHPAWDLAAQFSEDTGELLFLTDHLPSTEIPVPKHMEIISVGRRVENVALTAARWTFDSNSGEGRLFMRVHNLGANPADVSIRGRAAERLIFQRTLPVPAGGSVPLETKVAGGLKRLTIEAVTPRDGLDIDNTITLIEPKVRMLALALTLPAEHSARQPIQRVLAGIKDIQFDEAERAQLIIGPGLELPPSRRDLWWMGVGPMNPSPAARKNAKIPSNEFSYLVEKRHPLLDGVLLGGVVWAGVQPLELDVRPLVSAGRHVLLGLLDGTQTTGYLMNIDLAVSNFSESPDWPIIWKNLVDLRRDSLPGLRRWNYRLNEEIRFRLYEGESDPAATSAEELLLVHSGRTRPLARSSIVEVPPLDDTGIYEFRDGTELIGEVAVNFEDVEESALARLSPGSHAPAVEPEPGTFLLDQTFSWLMLLAIGLIMLTLLADWRVLKTNPMAR